MDVEKINECEQTTDICSNIPNSNCIDTINSYECICKSGYEMVDEMCDGYIELQYLYYILHRIY